MIPLRSTLNAALACALIGPTLLWAGLFDAADNGGNEPYASSGQWSNGDNGGYGFKEWQLLNAHGQGFMNILYEPENREYLFQLGGGRTVGRALESALSEGTWVFESMHSTDAAFSGFTVYADASMPGSEIFRFGMRTDGVGDTTGLYYSTDSGLHYTFWDVGDTSLMNTTLQYSLAWNALGEFTLGVNGLYISDVWEPTLVGGIGALLLATTENATLAFNNLSVSGTPSAIPEPATCALLLCGGALLLARRRRH